MHYIIANTNYSSQEGIGAFLAGNACMVHRADNADALTHALQQHMQGIVIYSMPFSNDDAATLCNIYHHYEDIKVIACVHPYDLYSLRLCLRHNVAACISNSTPPCEMLTALREVSSGDRYHCQMVQQAIRRYGITTIGRPLFSEKELQVLQYITQDKTTAQIATLLYSSPYTIDAIRKRMMAKTGTPNITALVCYALRLGYIRLEAPK